MRQYFPFTDYDFYAYLTSGFFVIVGADYAFTSGTNTLLHDWVIFESVLLVTTAYITGQVFASFSSVVLEHILARRVFSPPLSILMGAPPSWHERMLSRLLGRGYTALHKTSREQICQRAARQLHKSTEEIEADPSAVFSPAYQAARSNDDCRGRVDGFRNQYGFARNLAFVGLTVATMLLCNGLWATDGGLIVIYIASMVMLVRFFKFYAAFMDEVLRYYAFGEGNDDAN